jgi:hypothetical protein
VGRPLVALGVGLAALAGATAVHFLRAPERVGAVVAPTTGGAMGAVRVRF